LRRQYNVCDYYLTSAAAVSEEGDLFFVDLTGSRVGPIAHSASNVVVVVGANKIAPKYDDAVRRGTKISYSK
jgi:hypothetical protein